MLKGIAMYTGLDQSEAELKAFFAKIKNQPLDFIFTSFHIAEAKNPSVSFLLDLLKETNIKLVVDFSKKRYDEFGYNPYIIPRLDYGFSVTDIRHMLEVHDLLELNASVINLDLLLALKKANADFNKMRVSFNFYPKPLTGMAIDDVKAKIKLYHEFGLKAIIYIPCQNKRAPLYQGLPTIEAFRYQSFEENVKEAYLLDLDGICVGDALISDEELVFLINYKPDDDAFQNLDFQPFGTLNDEEWQIINSELTIRNDESPLVVRSSSKRGMIITPHQTAEILKRGSVVIDNTLLARYSGELSIIKQDVKNPGTMNLVGFTTFKPELIKGGSKIRFKL